MVRKDAAEKRRFCKGMQILNRKGAHSDEIAMKSSLRERLVYLLEVLSKNSPQYSQIVKTVLDDVLFCPNVEVGDEEDDKYSMDNED